MTVPNTPFLRNALLLDAVVSGAAAILMAAGASLLSPLLGLPQPLLLWSGLALVPFVAVLLALSRRPAMSRLMLVDIIGLNALWVAGSLALLVTDLVSPNLLGQAFIVAQAAAVGLFAVLQWSGMRRAATTA